MIKLFKTVFVIAAFVGFAYANTQLSEKQIKDIESLELFKNAQIKVERGFDAGDVYLLNIKVRGQAHKIYLTKSKKYLIQGEMVDTNSGMPLIIPDIPVDLKPTIGKEALTFGTGKEELVLFTDPECPFCKKFESYFDQIKDKVKMRVFFYPLPMHTNAKDLSLYIMSKKTNAEKVEAMHATAQTPDFKNRKISDSKLKTLEKDLAEQMDIANKLGVRGTPTLYNTKGEKISWAALLQKYGVDLK